MQQYAVAIEGLEAIKSLDDLPERIARAAFRAINTTADRSRTDADRAIRLQVAFAASYLAPSAGRLTVTKRANGDDLAAVITARGRPTSLARYVVSGQVGKRGGVAVEVKPGLAKFMPRAFLMRLRAGAGPVDDANFNLGLAIRLKPGESIHNKKDMVRIASGLYLLYGPAVAQVFSTVSEDIAPAEAQFLEDEFSRLVALDA
jgi:hypothetical protein